MRTVIGFAIVFLCVFGAFAMFGGNIEIILHAIPHEFVTIGGGAIGAFVVANSMTVIKKVIKGLKQSVKGEKWRADEYKELLSLVYMMIRMFDNDKKALEGHIENPEESSLFARFPKVMEDPTLVDFVCGYLRMMTLGLKTPHVLQEIMENNIDKLHHEHMKPQHALQNMADGLPAIGIVAAVLGVINTMGSINQPTEVLGGMIGSALVGTFLGVLMSYCIVGPLAARLAQVVDEDLRCFEIVKAALVAKLHGLNATVALETGRLVIPSAVQPTFKEFEEMLEELPSKVDNDKMAKAA